MTPPSPWPWRRRLALPLILAGVSIAAYAALLAVRTIRAPMPEDIERGRAFDLRVALGLAVLVSVVLVVSGILTAAAGRAGLIIGTATLGDRRFAFDVWPGLVLMLAGAWGGAAIAGVL